MKYLLLAAFLAGPDELPDAPGKAAVLKICGTCHAANVVLGTNNTKRGWTELVDEMISKGAAANARERREIIAYLTAHFPMRAN